MHSTIYELSEQPISKSRRATIDSLPEWFFQTVADSQLDTDDITRALKSVVWSSTLATFV